ncbi:hypothetical protein EVAR_74606_1 [Eumeta japonica]|uniref:Uncharacterized protein n=1 Tax=Eumeta variegata TaxID=151549 RepID=A0A4C1WAN2_EUMVA|nr:hypothetical protein EVAR_74606_1 [Eumeta japonica]
MQRERRRLLDIQRSRRRAECRRPFKCVIGLSPLLPGASAHTRLLPNLFTKIFLFGSRRRLGSAALASASAVRGDVTAAPT